MRFLTLIGLIALVAPTANCASSSPISLDVPPRIEMPQTASAPCELYVLPPHPSQGDLDIGYATRGAQLVACDVARRLAVATFEAEHKLQKKQPVRRRWWPALGR